MPMANPQANFPDIFLLSHCWTQAFTELLEKSATPQKSQWSHGSNNIHTGLCRSCGVFTFHARYYPLPSREWKMEITSLFIDENTESYKTF